jgi:hypothetical protein
MGIDLERHFERHLHFALGAGLSTRDHAEVGVLDVVRASELGELTGEGFSAELEPKVHDNQT